MRYVLYAFLAGALSAFAFEPVGWWPLLLIAIAASVRAARSQQIVLAQPRSLAGHLASASSSIGLNWIATSFTYQSNMPAWLGWVAVVLLSIYLAVYPMIATGAAWRFWRENRVTGCCSFSPAPGQSPNGFAERLFTGFPWNPAAAAVVPTPLITISALTGTYGLSAPSSS